MEQIYTDKHPPRCTILTLPFEIHIMIASYLCLTYGKQITGICRATQDNFEYRRPICSPSLLMTCRELRNIYKTIFLDRIANAALREIENGHRHRHSCSCYDCRPKAEIQKGCFKECEITRRLSRFAPLSVIIEVLDRAELRPHKITTHETIDCVILYEAYENNQPYPPPIEYHEDSFQTLCTYILNEKTNSLDSIEPELLEIVEHLAARLGPVGLKASIRNIPCLNDPLMTLVQFNDDHPRGAFADREKLAADPVYREKEDGIQEVKMQMARVLIEKGFDLEWERPSRMERTGELVEAFRKEYAEWLMGGGVPWYEMEMDEATRRSRTEMGY